MPFAVSSIAAALEYGDSTSPGPSTRCTSRQHPMVSCTSRSRSSGSGLAIRSIRAFLRVFESSWLHLLHAQGPSGERSDVERVAIGVDDHGAVLVGAED